MGATFRKMCSYYEYATEGDLPEVPRQVLSLAVKSLQPLLKEPAQKIGHLIVATSCPDSLAPSVSQMLKEHFSEQLADTHAIDIVQGCAGGVSGLILGSQLTQLNHSSTLVVQVDAARKATSRQAKINRIFGNGSSSCLITWEPNSNDLLHFKSRQHKGLSEVVTINLGHDADEIILKESRGITVDPRKHLGLRLNNLLALKLIREAERFYLEFVRESSVPDVMILHQVNPHIMKHLRHVFSKYPVSFVDVSARTGNCGAASLGIALDSVKETIAGKKVLLCGFGTGGVITAGLWQN